MTPCIVCNKDVSVHGLAGPNMPYAMTTFHTYGHYGSTFFDPLDGSYIEINICDECLMKAAKTDKIVHCYSDGKSFIDSPVG